MIWDISESLEYPKKCKADGGDVKWKTVILQRLTSDLRFYAFGAQHKITVDTRRNAGKWRTQRV